MIQVTKREVAERLSRLTSEERAEILDPDNWPHGGPTGAFLLVVDCGETGTRATRLVRRFETLEAMQEAKRQVDAERYGHGCWRNYLLYRLDPARGRLVPTKQTMERRELEEVREVDPDGRIVLRHRTVDTLGKLLRSGTITEAMHDAGRAFQRDFQFAEPGP